MAVFLYSFYFITLLCVISNAQNCEPIGTLLPCGYNETKYNDTIYTNLVATSIEDVANYVLPLRQLIDTQCSPQTLHFGCAAVFPSCTTGRGPCRRLCERVADECSKVLIQEETGLNLLILAPLLKCVSYRTDNCVDLLPINSTPPTEPSMSPSPSPIPGIAPQNSNNSQLNETGCPPPSRNYYTDEAKSFSVGWIATWSVLCFLSTLLTIITFLIKPSRFEYPWRPIVYLSVCFNLHAIGYFFALILGRTIITCPGNEYVTTTISWNWEHVPCLLVFGFLYYSMMAAFLWWLTLTLSWFLASALKWSNEAIGHLAPFFHVISWVIPLLMVISLVAARVVSADELTGVCFIVRDNLSPSFYALLIGLIIPLMLFLVIGIIFLTIGLISVCRIHSILRLKGQEKETIVLEKLIIRIGVFVSVYIVPATVVIGCFCYELDQQPNWSTVEESEECDSCRTANPTVFMVRIFMFLLIGILTGVWIWSKKTLTSWRDLGKKLQGCCVTSTPHHMPSSGSSSSTA